ncbi:MAG TPA: ABC transporter ATP-binding protein [Candidatus Eremiobacteraceae bacterium]|nr:ABC transporter ATP-binding protein [Candidatus Eremiobacteraceae bacterium]
MSTAMRARGLHKVYGSGHARVCALQDVSLDVTGGEVLVLMGPSGSGKTTLLSVLAGILTPTTGSVYVDDTEITALTRRDAADFRRRHFGFVFQGFNLFGALSARENVELALHLKGVRGAAARDQSHHLLQSAGIGHRAGSHPRDLSGGEKQRVSIARALACDPSVVFADEPTASLDSESGHAVIALLRALAKERGCTVFIVTHDSRIADVADRVVYLSDGALAEPAAR